MLFSLFVLALVVGGIGWVASRLYFEQLWPQIDAILGGRLSGSIFHTLSRDQVIAEVLSTNLIVVAGLAVAALWALLQKKWGLLAMIIMLDMFYNTQGMLFFVPSSVYPTQEQVAQQLTHTTQAPFSALIEPTARVLTRNSNKPYTAFDSYWEAMVVRAPFSDSFVDRYELITGQHAIRLRDGLTPDWNMVYQVPMVHGYTTMLPQDYTAFWQRSETTEVGVNFLDSIELDNPLLSQWAVKYYLVDTWFEVSAEEQQELQALSLVAESQTWQLYELPALSRFRYENNEEVEILHLNEHPTLVDLTFVNPDPERRQLILADRFENGWQAWVNGQEVAIENYQGMRRVPIDQGENNVIFEYQPITFYSGVATTALTAGILGVSSWWFRRSRPKIERASKISRK